MRTFLVLFVLAIGSVFAAPSVTKPPIFLLAGDSTTATQSSGGGGWGDGFLNKTFKNGATGTNYGSDGKTTASYRSGGYWDKVIAAVKSHASTYSPHVTIQFGHNDQKSTSGVTIAQFTSNLEAFVSDVKSAGGIPILLTSLSRRNFNSASPPVVADDLADVRNATIAAATASGATLLHLNEKSAAYLNAIGPTDAYTYNLDSTDHTHLNVEGSIVFGSLVAKLMLANSDLTALTSYLTVDATVSKDLDKGVYYWP